MFSLPDSFYSEFETSRKELLKGFTMQKYQLDDFQCSLLGHDENYNDLFKVLKIAKIFSHGNAQVESGFSVNSDLVVENLPKES